MPTVRTTFQPDREIEVDAAEYLDLQRQGLLVDGGVEAAPQTGAGAPTTTAAPAATKKTGAAGSKES